MGWGSSLVLQEHSELNATSTMGKWNLRPVLELIGLRTADYSHNPGIKKLPVQQLQLLFNTHIATDYPLGAWSVSSPLL